MGLGTGAAVAGPGGAGGRSAADSLIPIAEQDRIAPFRSAIRMPSGVF